MQKNKIILEIIRNNDRNFIFYLFEKFKNNLTTLGYHIILKSFKWMHLEKDDLSILVFRTCEEIYKYSDDIILNQHIYQLLKYSFIQKLILYTRQQNCLRYKVLNEAIYVDDVDLNSKGSASDNFNNIKNIHNNLELYLFLKNNKKKILEFDENTRKIFVLYYKYGLNRRDIVSKFNINKNIIDNCLSNIKRKCLQPKNK